VARVRVIAPRLGNVALKVQTYRVGTVRVNSHPTDTPMDEVVRSEVGPYPDPLFPIEKNRLAGIPYRDIMVFRFHSEGHAAWDLSRRGRDRHRKAEVKTSVSRRSLRCNRAERTKALGHELALV
jgi:hypothetical protein